MKPSVAALDWNSRANSIRYSDFSGMYPKPALSFIEAFAECCCTDSRTPCTIRLLLARCAFVRCSTIADIRDGGVASRVRPNWRLKLSARGGRSWWNRSFLSAAAAGRSLSASR